LNSDPECIFCKIVAGRIPALRVYEDDSTLAFLDIGPLAEGHTLVIPKEHFATLTAMPGDQMAALARQLPRLTQAVIDAVSAQGCNVLVNQGKVAGQEVPHVHWHIIPRVASDGLGYRWNASTYRKGRAEQVLQRITAALQG
jgi:histidine triad (HIT) family protein